MVSVSRRDFDRWAYRLTEGPEFSGEEPPILLRNELRTVFCQPFIYLLARIDLCNEGELALSHGARKFVDIIDVLTFIIGEGQH